MKRGTSPIGGECFSFGTDNKLRIFPPNTYKFKPRDHIVLDDIQECILDNFWFQYNNKREDKGYILAILNSLAEYFHMINGKIQPKEPSSNMEKKAIYVIYRGKTPGIYISFEEVIAQQIEKEKDGGVSWEKYLDIDQALSYARTILGVNYYLEPAAKDYIQKYKKANEIKPIWAGLNIREEGSSRPHTYKEAEKKDIDPLNEEYVNTKIKEKLETMTLQWKKDIKEEILQEIKGEIDAKFENIMKDYEVNIKKDYESKMNIQISDYDENDDEMLDIRGHGQRPKY